MNKLIEDYDLLKVICSNGQPSGRHSLQFENTIAKQMDISTEPEASHHNEQYDDLNFGGINAHGNASLVI